MDLGGLGLGGGGGSKEFGSSQAHANTYGDTNNINAGGPNETLLIAAIGGGLIALLMIVVLTLRR